MSDTIHACHSGLYLVLSAPLYPLSIPVIAPPRILPTVPQDSWDPAASLSGLPYPPYFPTHSCQKETASHSASTYHALVSMSLPNG